MSREELFKLRREVRRSEDISDAATRLFCEIMDLHQLSAGCIAQDVTLADYINKSPRTVARRRQELIQAGYLREEPTADGRQLVPKWPNDPKTYGETLPDKSDESPDTSDETPDTRDNGAPDKSDEHREINIPAEAGESAHAREAVGIFRRELRSPREIYDEPREIELYTSWTRQKLDIWRECCIKTRRKMRDPSSANLNILFDEFDDALSDRNPDERSAFDRMPGPPVNAN